ncbi:MAG: hypothetical protein PHE09_15665 [Oscillospiraceae bacterium]|nr:hypothetical protein [Oscillospiraceae bacterium]
MKYDNLPDFEIKCCNGKLSMIVDGQDVSSAFSVSFEYGGLNYPSLKVQHNYIGFPNSEDTDKQIK